MARKKRAEEHENHERWLVSYADFITLLFAFFVVMYSISSVNEGKYRVLSDALVAAFRAPAKSLDPVQVGKLAKSPSSSMIDLPYEYRQKLQEAGGNEQQVGGRASQAASAALGEIRGAVQRAMRSLIDQDMVRVRQGKGLLEIELNASILFPSGSAALNESALPVLRRVAEILRHYPNPVQVEGHTDNLPIRSLVYPSNWELSASRSASVVQLFTQYGIDPARMAAVGYGEYRPIASNATQEGRRQNRRVTLVILASEQTTPAATAAESGTVPVARTPPAGLSPIPAPIGLPGAGRPTGQAQ